MKYSPSQFRLLSLIYRVFNLVIVKKKWCGECFIHLHGLESCRWPCRRQWPWIVGKVADWTGTPRWPCSWRPVAGRSHPETGAESWTPPEPRWVNLSGSCKQETPKEQMMIGNKTSATTVCQNVHQLSPSHYFGHYKPPEVNVERRKLQI